MTPEILQLEKRRRYKRNLTPYRRIHKQIKKRIREAKSEWITGQCEELDRKHGFHGMYQKVREITGRYKIKKLNTIYGTIKIGK